MEINIYTVLYLLGALQALIFIFMLVGRNRMAWIGNKFLMALMGSIFLVLVQYAIMMNDLGGKIPWIWPLGTAAWYTISPLLLLFSLAVSRPGFRLRSIHLLLLLFPLYILVQFFFESAGIYVGLHLLFENKVVYSNAWLLTYHFYGLLLGGMSLRALNRGYKAGTLPMAYLWLRSFLLVFLIGVAISTALLLWAANPEVYAASFEWVLVLLFELFVFVLIARSLRSYTYIDTSVVEPVETSQEKPLHKYANSVLSTQDFSRLAEKLTEVMEEEEPYLDQKLSLANLSILSGIQENHLSQLFSQHLQSNFYDYVNTFRLRALEKRLLDPNYQHFKIVSIAEDCGFTSKASFYRFFKAAHGMTPTAYLKAQKEN